ncbi:MAG: hypothetical protein NC826_01500, partial [Candidatus Omnitrophica bacterium]|nr:hypothetical protein [Candidatus Omnitrophota bacterium]
KEKLIKEQKEEIEKIKIKIITQANLQKQKIILWAKNQVIEDIFNSILEKIETKKIPTRKKIFKDKVVEELLSKEEFVENLKERFKIQLANFLKLDEKYI